jgi:DNA invertase Pin-like site-specific DNA recombinase
MRVSMFVRAYLRASTDEQDATRARAQLEAFVAERGLTIAAWYLENESGAKLARPELFLGSAALPSRSAHRGEARPSR